MPDLFFEKGRKKSCLTVCVCQTLEQYLAGGCPTFKTVRYNFCPQRHKMQRAHDQDGIIMAINIESGQEGVTVGAAYIDFFKKELGACQFVDDDHFCTLEAVALQLGAKECVIPKVGLVWIWLLTQNNPFASPIRIHCIFPSFSVPLSYSLLQATEAGSSSFRTNLAHLNALLNRCNLVGTERPFPRSKNLTQDLGILLKSGSLEQHKDALEGHLAETSLAGIVSWLRRTCMLAALLTIHCLPSVSPAKSI